MVSFVINALKLVQQIR